ncbi:MAG: hypothetical protein N2Z23_10295 [Pyrinomonadaceae bacterium]|nr:hypothetical protein [Pyrinomonadaceae bacterium]MCX7640814.1 hypothetical protein [Pyrinomonadaceae bacterium]MDW8303421.1 hypothetical protein [Acidobacteriota bacterium]
MMDFCRSLINVTSQLTRNRRVEITLQKEKPLNFRSSVSSWKGDG